MTIRIPKHKWERAKRNEPRNVTIAKAKTKRARVVSRARAQAAKSK
jgi:hypothetical protein